MKGEGSEIFCRVYLPEDVMMDELHVQSKERGHRYRWLLVAAGIHSMFCCPHSQSSEVGVRTPTLQRRSTGDSLHRAFPTLVCMGWNWDSNPGGRTSGFLVHKCTDVDAIFWDEGTLEDKLTWKADIESVTPEDSKGNFMRLEHKRIFSTTKWKIIAYTGI